MGIVWLVLAVIKKRHLLYKVTNWILVVGICVNLIAALVVTAT